MTKNPVSRKNDIVVQELNDEVLIYDLKENKAFCLNQTSAAIWQMCDGNRSVADMSRMLGQKLNSPVAEDLVWLAIDQLKKENLLTGSEEINSPFGSVSRREAIKKVGLSAVIALPLVASITAPTATNAASPGCNSTSAACTAPNNRPAGCCCGNGQQSCLNTCVGTGNGGEKVCT